MKTITVIAATLILTLTTITTMAQPKNQEVEISEIITKFVNAADQQDARALESILDADFRLSLNQMFGGTGLILIDKKTYLDKIRIKEFGGDKRTVKLEQLLILNNNASVKAIFIGKKMTVATFIHLIKTNTGEWKILNDLPCILK